jgi:ketosteroid isomerase-like protein
MQDGMSELSMSNLSIALQYMEKIAAGDLDAALAMTSDNAQFQGPQGEQFDKDGLRSLFNSIKPLLINPLRQEILGTTSEGSRVAVEARASTLLANGNTYSNIYHFLFEVVDGEITVCREYNNTMAISAFGFAK